MDSHALRHVAKRHPVQAIPREKIFGRVKDLLERIRALLPPCCDGPRFTAEPSDMKPTSWRTGETGSRGSVGG